MNIGNISMIGVRLVLYTEHRLTVYGVVVVQALEIVKQRKFWR